MKFGLLAGACVALTLDIAYARCVTAPSLLALCDCISSNLYVFPSSAVLFGCLAVPLALKPTLYRIEVATI